MKIQKQVSHFPTALVLFLSKPKAATGFSTSQRDGKNSCRQTEKILDAEQKSDVSKGCNWKDAKFSANELISAVVAPLSADSSQIEVQAVTNLDVSHGLSYSWQVLQGEATISNGDSATPSLEFTSGPGTYVVRVTVTDVAGLSTTGETTVVYEAP